MFIDKQSLKRAFGLFAAFLYVVGFGVYHAEEFGQYQRILNDAQNTLDLVKRLPINIDVQQGQVEQVTLTFDLLPNSANGIDSANLSIAFNKDYTCRFIYDFKYGTNSYNTDDAFDGDNLVFNLSNAYLFDDEYLTVTTLFYCFDSDGNDTLSISVFGDYGDYVDSYVTTATTSNWLANNGFDGTTQRFRCNYVPLFLIDYLFDNSDTAYWYNQGFDAGKNEVLNNLETYNLVSYADYLAYGTAQYNQGLEDGSNVLSMSGVINEIFKAPITMFTGIFNSDAFQWRLPTGEILDIGGLMTFLLTIGIALAIVRLIMKVGGK